MPFTSSTKEGIQSEAEWAGSSRIAVASLSQEAEMNFKEFHPVKLTQPKFATPFLQPCACKHEDVLETSQIYLWIYY